jgi:hypothetical protein
MVPVCARPVLGAFATDQAALRVERVAVGSPAVGAEGADQPLWVHLQDAVAGDVAEEQIAGGVKGWALQKAHARRDLQ